jgi:thiamine transporter ThiT
LAVWSYGGLSQHKEMPLVNTADAFDSLWPYIYHLISFCILFTSFKNASFYLILNGLLQNEIAGILDLILPFSLLQIVCEVLNRLFLRKTQHDIS